MDNVKENKQQVGTHKETSIEVEMEPFRPDSVFEFVDKFDEDKWALKALCELLGRADLEMFSDGCCTDKNISSNYRWGLQKLFEMWLERQEQRFEKLRVLAINSPETIIDSARDVWNGIEKGWYNPSSNDADVRRTLENIDEVLTIFGSERYPEAEVIKKDIISKIKAGHKVNVNGCPKGQERTVNLF